MKKKFYGWVREWGQPWRVECTGTQYDKMCKYLDDKFGKLKHTSTLILEDGETPQVNQEISTD